MAMNKSLLLIGSILVSLLVAVSQSTPLDDYVNLPDPTYSYKLAGSLQGEGYTAYFLNLTSQTWLTAKDSSRPVWVHWLTICVPTKVDFNTALLFIDGGEDDELNTVPTEIDDLVQPACGAVNAVVACINQIPDEPIYFADGVRRVEDMVIAYTWSHFINDTTQPYWLARMPMTKACVKAMDAVQSFMGTFTGVPAVQNFVVAGASKRGWTTWTTGIVDKRVIGIVPIVIPILNMVPNLNHQWESLGEWSFALDDYLDMGLMNYLNQPVFQQMGAIIDPYSYLDRLTMPKYLICASGDEFFMPDSTRYFWNDLPDLKRFRLVPNAEHSLIGHQYDVIQSMISFFNLLVTNQSIPNFSWNLVRSNTTGTITLKLLDDYVPTAVRLWTAHTLSFQRRDFRLIICDDIAVCIQPVLWFDELLTSTNGVYEVTKNAPSEGGWLGFYIEVEYTFGGAPLVFSSELNVVPDYSPFPNCGNHCQQP